MRSYHSPVKSDYCLIKNSVTGEEGIIDLRMSRYKKIMRGFLNSLKLKPMVVKHIVLGQCVESYRPTLLNNFLNYVRRYYGEIVYVWTVEVQGKRLEKYGEAVLHWHLLIAFEWGTEFTKDDI